MKLGHAVTLGTLHTVFPIKISAARFALAPAIIVILSILMSLIPGEYVVIDGLKIILATASLGIVPGVLLVLLTRALRRVTILELIGLGVAISLGLTQILTMASILLHVSSAIIALSTVVVSGLAAVLIFLRRSSAPTVPQIRVDKEEVIIALFLVLLSVLLYLRGSPMSNAEDLIHVSIVRRLSMLANPALDNIYYAQNVIYTYPFPGTHFFYALVSKLGNLDPVFVYREMRFFWGPAAIVLLYLAARMVVQDVRIAYVSTATAIAFVLSGAFAEVPGFLWGQLAPISHASDVAMGVLLPCLLVTAFYYVECRKRRSAVFFLLSSLALVLMLTMVHIRETVQFLVYFGSFLIGLVILNRDRGFLKKTTLLVAATVAIVLAYGWWSKDAVGHVDVLVEARRTLLLELAKGYSLTDWLARPFQHPLFVWAVAPLFTGWNPIVLLASPFVFFVFRKRVFVLLVGASILTYVLIIRFPLFAVPYVYLSYYEILVTPVRNMIFFIHLLAGVLFYLLAVNLAKIRSNLSLTLAITVVVCSVGLLWGVSRTFWSLHPDLLLLPTILAYLLAFGVWLSPLKRHAERWSVRLQETGPDGRWQMVYLALVFPLAVFSAVPASSPAILPGQLRNALPSVVQGFECSTLTDVQLPPSWVEKARPKEQKITFPSSRRACPANYQLITWARDHLAVDSVLAINVFNSNPPTPFIQSQIVAWPLNAGGLYNPEEVFPKYYSFLLQAIARYQTQPFFNNLESIDERLRFIRELRVTHVLVDPMYYEEMKLALAPQVGSFQLVYDDGQWAVFEVVAR